MEAMEHAMALAMHAVDRYALGDMSEEEAASFEAHFFDCADCARDLRETVSFVENARVALVDGEVASPRSMRSARAHRATALRPAVALPWAALLVLGAVLLFQATVTIPRLRGNVVPRALEPTVLRVVRSVEPVVQVDGVSFLLVIDLTAPEPFSRYRVEFRTEAGDEVATVESDAPRIGTLHLELPAERFPDGRYSAVLIGVGDGATRRTLETYRFRVANPNN